MKHLITAAFGALDNILSLKSGKVNFSFVKTKITN